MRHYVFWRPESDEKAQELIAGADDPAALVRIFNEIDHWLSRDPLDFGESRYENVRIAFIHPIGVQFEVLEDPPTVIVLAVWRVN